LLPFSLISCVYSYAIAKYLRIAINDVAEGGVYHVRSIPRKLVGHNFVSGLRTLKPKKPKINLKT